MVCAKQASFHPPELGACRSGEPEQHLAQLSLLQAAAWEPEQGPEQWRAAPWQHPLLLGEMESVTVCSASACTLPCTETPTTALQAGESAEAFDNLFS